MQIVLVVHDAQCFDHFVVIEKGLSLPHNNDVAHAGFKIFLHERNLLNQFGCRKIAGKTLASRCAEGTGHRAAHLRGNAHGESFNVASRVVQGHTDRFDKAIVIEFQHVFSRAVLGNLAVEHRDLLGMEGECQFLAQGAGHVGHLVYRSAMVLVNPLVNLLCAKRGEAPRLHEIGEVIKRKFYQFVIHGLIIDNRRPLIYFPQIFFVRKGAAMSMALDPSSVRVALLAGGTSGEREISLASGEGAGAALREAGFIVDEFDPALKNDLKRLIDGNYDVAFLCLHGKGGEDGRLQGFLETIGLPYTGPGVWASATAMNKGISKLFYQRENIPTAPFMCLQKEFPYEVGDIAALMGGRCVVKPATEGSALGIYIVEGEQAIAEAIEAVFEIDDLVIVEKFIEGMEITVAVIGNDDARALPIIEIVPRGEFYDFDSKYAPGGSQHICPARLDEQLSQRIQEQAVAAHRALDCTGVSRSDFILDDQGVAWILETNTIPGMTATSLLPDAARAAGIEFPELCTRLIEYALEKR